MPKRLTGPWVLIPLATVAAVGAGVLMAVSLLLLTRPTDQGSAFTLLLVQRNPPVILGNPQQPAFDRDEWDSYRRAQVALVKSRLVINAALRDPKVVRLPGVMCRADPVEWLEKRLSADFEVAPEVLRISVTADNEKEAVALANAVREAYLREVVEKEQELRVKRLDKLR